MFECETSVKKQKPSQTISKSSEITKNCNLIH